jgi:uncharacterized repeat protein (TIGR03803 family)
MEVAMKTRLFRTALLRAALTFALAAGGAQADSLKVIHSFTGADGAYPDRSGVAPAPHASFYVATIQGGAFGKGALTLIKKDGTSQVLHSFGKGSDGRYPSGTPFRWSLDGNIYGTTERGGASHCGTIYKYVPRSGAYQQVYAAECAPDGDLPEDGLADVGGVLEATTFQGGPSNVGALIFVRSDGSAGTGCHFSGNDGDNPSAGIIEANGNSYTAVQAGGVYGNGTITEFHGFTCNTSVLHSFAGGTDGEGPDASLLFYNNALYGTTFYGGAPGLGTVFRIGLDGSGYTVLHTFQGICCGSDGSFPLSGLTLNPEDNMLYGITNNGGNSSDLGTVFQIDPNTGAETVVHSFSGTDGANPEADLYIDKKGHIYGTTGGGGANNVGVVFKLTP